MSASLLRLLTLSLLLVTQFAVGSRNANAFCSPLPHFLAVGNTSSDSNCGYDTIQDAIDNVVCPDTTIVITSERVYTAQHLTINNKSMTLSALAPGVGCAGTPPVICPPDMVCTNPPPPTTPQVIISGAGSAGPSVLSITGNSSVTLQYLEITGGKRSADFTGGGIDFAGSGTLTLDTSWVTNNSAGFGGGINVSGSPGLATLLIKANTFITSNTAQDSGGGIRVVGNARLFMLEDNTFVAFNTATSGDGGAVQVIGPARGDIGSPGAGVSLGVIYGNTAVNGGGVSVDASENSGQALLRMFTTDATRPVRISGNAASANGGGIYLKPYPTGTGNLSARASLCAHDYRLDGNAAMEGTAIYTQPNTNDHQGVDVLLEPTSVDTESVGCDPETPASLGAVSCAVGAGCNLIDGNEAVDINNNNAPTAGATIFGQPGIVLTASPLTLRGNSGGYALRETGNTIAESTLSNCIFAENQLQHELFLAEDGFLSIDNCTLANDLIGATHVIRTDTGMTLTNSIIDEAGTLALAYSGDTTDLDVTYVLSNEIATLAPTGLSNPTVVKGDPMFVDLAHGNYHLLANTITASPAINFAPLVPGNDFDMDGRPRDQDVAGVRNLFGYRDLGAYEMQPIADRIFADAFSDAISLVY